MKNFLLYLSIVLTLVIAGCKKENITQETGNNGNPIAFETQLLESDLDTLTGTNGTNTIYDALITDDGTLWVNIGLSLYAYKDGQFTKKLEDVLVSSITVEDGIFYVLGAYNSKEVLCISTDNGNTFSLQERFISDLGQDYALNIYYNGIPDNILVKKTADGSYTLWTYRKFEQSLGGTGFTVPRYCNYAFTSSDGISWQIETSENGILPSAIWPGALFKDGTMWLNEVVTDGQTYTNYTIRTNTNNFNVNESQPVLTQSIEYINAMAKNDQAFYIKQISWKEDAIAYDDKTIFKKWNGSGWNNLSATVDSRIIDATPYDQRFLVEKVNFTSDNRMVLINSRGVLISSNSLTD